MAVKRTRKRQPSRGKWQVPRVTLRIPSDWSQFARSAGIVALFVIAAILGTASGVLFAYAGDMPAIRALDNYSPSTITRVYGRDGRVVGEFATERRDIISYDEISPLLRNAIIATEDADFNRHFGVNLWRIVVTFASDIIHQREYGASTLTQQLTRNLFPKAIGSQKTLERKIKEALAAIQIEKRYTKQEILTMYCNQIYLGNAYGVEAESRVLFGKHARDLNLEEAATIAGIIQLPSRENPIVNMKWAMQRRNYALQRMAEEGYITGKQAAAAKARPIVLAQGAREQQADIAPYFLEEVRQHLEKEYGAKALYQSGLAVYTSLDLDLQKAADEAVDKGLRRIDKVRGWRRPTENVLAGKHTLEGYDTGRWHSAMKPGDIVPAVVMALTGSAHQNARIRIGHYTAELTAKDFKWTHRTSATSLMKPGDLIQVAIQKVNAEKATMEVNLDQNPLVQGALVAIDNHTGQILAMVGGSSFDQSKFNRAVQAYRQVGSAFKPFVYTAAIDRGYTAATIIQDTPATFPQGQGLPDYEPQNYERDFEGPITLRHALEESRNVPAVRMMDQLTPAVVISYAKRFGLSENIPPFLSVALGTAETTALEMTSAYSVFPNQGVRMKPYEVLRVQDRDGNLLEENHPEPSDVIRADTAYVMTNLLRGVVLFGTGAADSGINWPLAGKTGTTDDYSDAWFIGFDPNITVGVWVGFDQRKQIFNHATGNVAALPIWTDFMKDYIARQEKKNPDPPAFKVPGNIVYVTVDKATGLPVPPGTDGSLNEAFIAGTQPGATGLLTSTSSAPSGAPQPQPYPKPQP
jgi:penicillin-binding protein 1A